MAEVKRFYRPVAFDSTVTFAISPTPGIYGDDAVLQLGTDGDIGIVLRSTVLNANTALTNVLSGTPVTPAVAIGSLIIGNRIDGGDILMATRAGADSQAALWVDGSASETRIYGGGVLNLIATASTTPTTASKGFRIGPTGASFFGLGTAEAVTIATGVATVTRPLVALAGEGATTDTLDSIVYTGQAAGDLLLIQCSGAYTITFDNSSTLILGAGTRAMAAGSTMLLLATSATVWREVTFLTAAS